MINLPSPKRLPGGTTKKSDGNVYIVVGNYSNLGNIINKRWIQLTKRNNQFLNKNSTFNYLGKKPTRKVSKKRSSKKRSSKKRSSKKR
jgi:hypothetical protein